MKIGTISVLKKNMEVENFDSNKIVRAINKTALRCNVNITKEQEQAVVKKVVGELSKDFDPNMVKLVKVQQLHELVELALQDVDKVLAVEYASFRGYKKKMDEHFEEMLRETEQLLHNGDNENANRDGFLISAQKAISGEIFSMRNMLDYELPKEASQAHKDGDIYIHDLRDRLYGSINCCLFDMANVLKGGFTYKGVAYCEPNSIRTACTMMLDIINSGRLNQYGGFTVPEVDSVLAPYVKKSWIHYYEMVKDTDMDASKFADEMTMKDLIQGLESIEHSLHMVNDTFITFTFALDTTRFGKMVSEALLQVRRKGLGQTGVPAVYPKLVFLYTDLIHGEGQENEDIFKSAIQTSSKCMYPDYLSLDNGYLGEVYHRTGKAISPMGCRAFLSEYKNEEGESIFTGRGNCGAITLNLPRFAIKSNGDMNTFYKLIDENFAKAIKVHQFTYNRMRKVKAKTNPLLFVHGGCHIQLDYEDTIEKVIDTFTWSIGYIGLDETIKALTGKQIHECPGLGVEILTHIDNLLQQAKKDTGLRLAMYSTPAESLCYKFLDKDKADFGIIEGVTDKEYYTNSFHMDVRAKLDPDQKMLLELPMFNIATGGRIVYNEYPHTKNIQAIIECVRYAMSLGLYYGVNLQLDSCSDCGYQDEIEGQCPRCGSTNILSINRICGYLGYTSTETGANMVNKGKFGEIEKRVDHFN